MNFRNLILLFIFALPFALQAQTAKTQKVVIRTAIACDHCQQCGSCAKRLEPAILKLKGVKMATVDADAQTITVLYNPQKIAIDRIREAITKTGFDADGLKADPLAYAKLDDCCQTPSTDGGQVDQHAGDRK